MTPLDWSWFAAAAGAAAMLTWVVRQHAMSRGMLDIPGARSSHTRPTPRGGGLAIFATALCALIVVERIHAMDLMRMAALAVGGTAVAMIGYIDDRKSLAVAPRLLVQLAASVLAVVLLLEDHAGAVFPELPRVVSAVLLVLGILWSINLFNFMDGIDGIAAAQAAFMAAASAGLAWSSGGSGSFVHVLLSTSGACLGFLVWNWPPAKIFMGDIGSGFLGFWLAALAVAMHVEGTLDIWIPLILGTIFVADASVTLAVRIASGQKWYDAHRSHAYQRLSRRFGSHQRVTAGVLAIDLLVLLPAAAIACRAPGYAPWIAVTLLLVFGAICAGFGAGRLD